MVKRFAFAVTAILLAFSLVACGAGSGPSIVENTPPAESGSQDAGRIEPENGGAAIILNMNGTDIHARLYDNAAADAFLKLLPYIHDIGILASTDPVALDQACIDLIYAQKDGDGTSLVSRIESRNGLHTLEHAEEIGLGSRAYNLVSVND